MREVPVVASPLKAPFSFHGRGARGEAASRARWRCATSLIGIGASLGLAACLLAAPLWAQIPGRNVNMVSGAELPNGDPFLRQQNEPSMAVSSRNPFHLFGFVNDYRTIDIPASDEPPLRMAADSWLGIFKSYDGGQSWLSTLLPGFPQDESPEGLASPIHGFDAAADPVVRAGAHGMFYLSAIALDREEPNFGALFLARYIDLNNKEGVVFDLTGNRDPIKYVDTVLVDEGTPGIFIDKPWMAVDVPRPGAGTCTITAHEDEAGGPTITQTFPAGNIYVAYADFVGRRNNIRSRIWVRRSTDCGATWDKPVKLSEGHPVNQGTTVAIDPETGDVYVAWRRFASCDDEGNCLPHAILAAKSTDGGWKFDKAVEVRTIDPLIDSLDGSEFPGTFDQPTLPNAAVPDWRGFRTNSYPTMAVDDTGRIYLAWTERGHGPELDARVVVATSLDGLDWTEPVAVDDPPGRRGHQVMPSLSFAGGKLTLLYYDQRNDLSQFFHRWLLDPMVLPIDGEEVDNPYGVQTIDVRMAQADPGESPVFTDYAAGRGSVQISRYRFAIVTDPELLELCADRAAQLGREFLCIRQLEANPPHLPMFRTGTVPFMGDYIDLAPSPSLLPPGDGQGWRFPARAEDNPSPVFHAVWTDNRDVQLPEDLNWASYEPPVSDFTDEPCVSGHTRSRDQNVYTSRVTQGLYIASPGNAKPVDEIQRAFVVFLFNGTDETRSFRLEIVQQPPDFPEGIASFRQFDFQPELDVTIPPRSSLSRTVFVISPEPRPRIVVLATEIDAFTGVEIDGGLLGSVILNPDILNPDILNPDILNPDILNPDILNAEVHNPDILNPDILNPDILNVDPDLLAEILNPDILNPDILNPDILNPDILNPDILNPDILNPDILNPDILNPDILNAPEDAELVDVNWEVQNVGNTTSAYNFELFLAAEEGEFDDFAFQLLVYRVHTTPTAVGCELVEKTHHDLVVNIRDPEIFDPSVLNPGGNLASFFLAPEERARITLRVLDPDRFDDRKFDLETVESRLVAIVAAQAVNTEDAEAGVTEPPVALVITTTSLADGIVGTPYSQTLQAIGGTPPYEWSILEGSLPAGLSLDPSSGEISGNPTSAGESAFTMQAVDSGAPQQDGLRRLTIRIAEPLQITTTSLADATVGEPYSQTLEATGGIAPYTWSEPAGIAFDPSTGAGAIGTACEGLTLDAAGIISGEPTAEGTCGPFTLEVRDSANPAQSAQQALSITVTPLPDLIIESMSHSPEFPTTADLITFTAVVQNIGAGPAGPSTLEFRIGGETPGTPQTRFPVPALEPGESFTQVRELQLTVAQNYLNTAIADIDDDVLEADETNNTLTHAFTVVEAFEPQLNVAFFVQPTDSVGDESISPVVVEVTDDTGTPLPGATVTVGIGDAACPEAVLSGGNMALTDVNGLATFPGLSIDRGSFGYTLEAQATMLGFLASSDTSDPFDVEGFCATGGMSTERRSPTATLLPNGQVLIAGGAAQTEVGGALAVLSSAELYDPATGRFTPTGSMTTARWGHTATLLPDGRVLVAGGSDLVEGPMDSAELYDPDTGTFTEITGSTMSTKRSFPTATLLGTGKVLIVGGDSDSADLFDPWSNSFAATGSMASLRWKSTSTLLMDGRVLVTGGFHAHLGLNNASAEIYDPATESFSLVDSLGTPRHAHSATRLPTGKVLITGGIDEVGSFFASAELFDPTTESFSATASMAVERGDHTAVLLTVGKVLIAGGGSDSADLFDPSTSSFDATGSLVDKRFLESSTLLPDGRVLVAGGTARTSATEEIFYPLGLEEALLVRPSSDGVTDPQGILPLTVASGISMQVGASIQLEALPGEGVEWATSNPDEVTVNADGLLTVVGIGNDDPNAANEVTITATSSTAAGSIKVNSFDFGHFPRYTTLAWRPVPGAVSYDVFTEFGNDCIPGTAICKRWDPWISVTGTDNLALAFEFVGMQPGRWWVVATHAEGIETSEIVYFRYTI